MMLNSVKKDGEAVLLSHLRRHVRTMMVRWIRYIRKKSEARIDTTAVPGYTILIVDVSYNLTTSLRIYLIPMITSVQ
jgi:hypothetical protein